MLANPIEQGPFESDIVTEPLRLQPLMAEDLFSFSEKLLIEGRLFDELSGVLEIFLRQTH